MRALQAAKIQAFQKGRSKIKKYLTERNIFAIMLQYAAYKG